MIYERIRPHPALSDIVESLWIQDDPSPGRKPASCVVPTGTIELLFHYRDPFEHVEGETSYRVPLSYVTGQRTRPVLPAATGQVGIIIVSLFPWALPCLFRQSPAELVDGYTDLGLLLPRERVRRLEEQLADGTREERIARVETFVHELRRGSSIEVRARAAVAALAARNEPLRMDQLRRELGWSERHFRRLFRSTVGVAPKTFQRVMRFQRALDRSRRGRSWPDAAADCGYSDQAHLIREVREFSGRTPGEVRRARERSDSIFNGTDASTFFDTVYI